ncbi:MAG: polyribonucleotide nucleotidyltransferase [Nitrospirota bacterium]
MGINIRDTELSLETGRIAKQADASVSVQYGDTIVLATIVSSKEPWDGFGFFPLTVDYQEKAYAAGKIPGGYFKREGRPTEKEILTSRLIDRPLRPLFTDGFCNETQIIVSVLSYGDENISDILGIIGTSAALTISEIPFLGPIGAVRIGRIGDKFIINPDLSEVEECSINLIVAGTEESVVMIEGGANEVSESEMIQAIRIAHQSIREIVELQKKFGAIYAVEKKVIPPLIIEEDIKRAVERIASEKIKEAIRIPYKQRRQNALDSILNETILILNSSSGQDLERDYSREISAVFFNLERDEVRGMILRDGVRVDGRGPGDIRPISCEVGVLPRAHGSAIFTRGETQSLVVATLGTSEDEQRIDALEGESTKAFMLHYNFPPFSVGEVKPLRSPGRREIGHGALAERALRPVIPDKTEFPYTIRVVSDILESNGSSSMATVCGGTLALMDAGVPIRSPVAGIAMGLIKEGDKTIVLSDILGLEDYLGDMDFKVGGTENGITAFQLDVKITGISLDIMEMALEQAREGRLHILKKMTEVISSPRPKLAAHAPRIYTIQIKPEKIRDVIGTGGKVVRSIIEQTGVKIDINDNGIINIASLDESAAQKAIEIINGIVAEAEVGKIYLGKVKRLVDFGAFVEILPGTEGLVHISQISDHRVMRVSDELREGDEILVKVIEIDKQGKIRLSRKEALRESDDVKRARDRTTVRK